MNSLKRYASKLEEQTTEIFNFKFNFPKIVHAVLNNDYNLNLILDLQSSYRV